MRHATPSEVGHDGTDHTRPLNELGHREAFIQARFLREAGFIPELILASSAFRAKETGEIIAEAMETTEAPNFGDLLEVNNSLYNAPGNLLLTTLQLIPNSVETLLLVAHMPGIAELLSHLTVENGEMTMAFQPATLVAVKMEDAPSWTEVGYGSGSLEWCLPPLLLHHT